MGAGPEIAVVVLAAGMSRRMGARKLLLPLGDHPVIAHAVAAACAASGGPVGVVLGASAGELRAALPPGRWEVVENVEYASGMASSLRAGVAWAAALVPATAGALILLGDQPLVTAAMVERLLSAARARPEELHAASFGGQRRHPVYFPRALFTEVARLSGDEGGRSILARAGERLRLVPLTPVEAALDVDTPEDYARVRACWARQSPADKP